MQNNHTELVFILDRSGSMHGLESDTIGGFNRVLAENKALEGTANVTTILFSSDMTLLHDRLPIEVVQPLTAADYRVGGSTALLDAVGMGIEKLAAVQKSLKKAGCAGKVQVVIVTDGYENASTHFDRAKIKRMINRETENGWDFIYLGASLDAVDIAAGMGISANRAAQFVADDEGVSAQYDAVCLATIDFRLTGSRTDDWKAGVEADVRRRK